VKKGNVFPVLGFLTVMLGLSCLWLFSCAMTHEASVQVDGSGSVVFHIEIQPVFLETLLEMAEFSGESEVMEEGTIFNLEKIREDFAKKPNIQLVSLDSPAPEVLDGEFRFTDIQEVFKSEAGLAESGVVTFKKSAGESSVRFYLDRENFDQVMTFLTFMDNPFFRMFSPVENEGTTEAEYLEMMEFLLGEEGPNAVQESMIEIRVNVKGRILSQKGGRIDGKSVIYEIPLLRVLLLEEPLEYSLVFK
jgi:hypothetical protein